MSEIKEEPQPPPPPGKEDQPMPVTPNEPVIVPAATNPPPPPTEKVMEVHKHTKTPRLNWKHYFWEFFMLFLAITLGFYVENFREKVQDRERIETYMHSMAHDLELDLIKIDVLNKRRTEKNRQCDSLIHYLMNEPMKRDHNKIYFFGRLITRRTQLHPEEGTLGQLRSTGSFRLIHNPDLMRYFNKYQLLLRDNDENIAVEETELNDYSQVAAKIFDVSVFQQMLAGDSTRVPNSNPALLTYDRKILNELSIKLHYWKRTSMTTQVNYDSLKSTGGALLGKIRDEYPLNN